MADSNDWRVTISLTDPAQIEQARRSFSSHEADEDARRKLGRSVAVGAGDSQIFLYAGTEVAARDAEGSLRGFLHFVPWGPDGASLDVMRRDRLAPSWLNDFLVVEAASRRSRLPRASSVSSESRRCPQNRRNWCSQSSTSRSGRESTA